jgi:hypothetical protein
MTQGRRTRETRSQRGSQRTIPVIQRTLGQFFKQRPQREGILKLFTSGDHFAERLWEDVMSLSKLSELVRQFLAERGLTLSEETCQIVVIRDGLTFLGHTVRKYGNTLHITPSKEGVLALVRKVGTLIRKYISAPVEALIKKLNQTRRGWANYHRHVVASEAFSRVDTYMYEHLWRMIRRRHLEKFKGWLIKR